jgi:single-strand DNA-binding protein
MASKSLNKVTLIGNLTRDPELKYTPQGTAVCSFGLATNRTWTTKTGETKEDVQFHRIVAWQKLAELCGNLLSKGRKVYVEGRIIYRNFEGKDGTQKQVTEIIIDDFILFDDKKRANGNTEETYEPTEETPEPTDVSEPETKVDPDDIPF